MAWETLLQYAKSFPYELQVLVRGIRAHSVVAREQVVALGRQSHLAITRSHTVLTPWLNRKVPLRAVHPTTPPLEGCLPDTKHIFVRFTEREHHVDTLLVPALVADRRRYLNPDPHVAFPRSFCRHF